MLTRGGPCARGCSFDWAWWCDVSWARSLDDRTSFQFLAPKHDRPRQRAVGSIARSTRPVDACGAEHLNLARADRIRRSIVSLDTTCATAQGGRPRQGQDRREGPYRLSKIHGRLSEKGTGLSGRRP